MFQPYPPSGQQAAPDRPPAPAPVLTAVHSVFGATVLGVIVPVLLWLTGLAAVWLLWRPASGAFFKPQGFARAQHGI